jgi:hypothetical protein
MFYFLLTYLLHHPKKATEPYLNIYSFISAEWNVPKLQHCQSNIYEGETNCNCICFFDLYFCFNNLGFSHTSNKIIPYVHCRFNHCFSTQQCCLISVETMMEEFLRIGVLLKLMFSFIWLCLYVVVSIYEFQRQFFIFSWSIQQPYIFGAHFIWFPLAYERGFQTLAHIPPVVHWSISTGHKYSCLYYRWYTKSGFALVLMMGTNFKIRGKP